MSNPTPATPPVLTPQERACWLRIREGFLMQLDAVEDLLGLPRTRISRRSEERNTGG